MTHYRWFKAMIVIVLLVNAVFMFAASPRYFLGTSANGYQVPKDGGLELMPIPGRDGWYTITIDFNEDNRDPMYDGHYYKVTDGTWSASGSWGTDHYAFQPAPVMITPDGQVAGLGSIYIKENTVLTILFDSNTKTIYDNAIQVFPTPRIYGSFNSAMGRGSDWSMKDGEALELADIYGDGTYHGFYTLPAFTGEGDGYMMATVLSTRFEPAWTIFGAYEQYVFDGTAGGMGKVSYLKPAEETTYAFTFDPKTKVTGVSPVFAGEIVALPGPTVYGDFNGWVVFGENALVFQKTEDVGKYRLTLTLPAYKGEGEGYMILVALSKKFYDDQWGKRWGVEEQYKLDGAPAGFGQASFLKPDRETVYTLTYDAATHVTSVSQ
ncbi:MAG: hypothetical protein KBC37_06120 [Thermotogae bacterium]|nr:hypothetical protein [Thermotogota bacterium]